MSIVAGFAQAVAFALVGVPLARWLLAPRGVLARLAWGFLLGVALWGALLFAGSHLAGLPLRRALLGPLLAAGAAMGLGVEVWWWRRAAGREVTPRRWGRGAIAVLAFGVLVWTGILAAAAIDPVTDQDGRSTWTAHARYMQAEATVDASAFRDPRWTIPHPRYPPLLPLLQLTVLELGGGDTRLLKPVHAAFWAALVVLAWDGGRRLAGERGAALAAAVAIGLPFPAFSIDGGAAGVYSDLPLACFAGAAALLLVDAREGSRAGVAAGLLLAAATLAKNEGIVLAGCMLCAGAVAMAPRLSRQRIVGRLGPALLMAALAAALLHSWRAEIPNRNDEAYAESLSAARLAAGAGRLPEVARLVSVETLDPRAWGGAAPLLVALGLWAACTGSWRDPRVLALTLAIGLAVASYVAAYLITPWEVAELVPVTWKRFLVQLLLPILLLAAVALERLFGEVPSADPDGSAEGAR